MLLIVISIIYFVLLVSSIIFIFKQPKKINSIYGYRTNLSMKNKENWFYSNKLASKWLLIITHVILFLSLLAYQFNLIGYLSFNISLFLITIIIPLVCFIFIIYAIENKLRKRNGKV